MQIKIVQQQVIKFYMFILCSIIGLSVYIYTDGTFLKACIIYIFFSVLSKLANITYHRYLAHGYFLPNKLVKILMLYSIVASGLVKPLNYVIGHRLHHKFSDSDKDPHPPNLGMFNLVQGKFNDKITNTVPIKDIIRQKDVMFVNNYYYTLYTLNLVIFYVIDPHIFYLSFLLLNLRYHFITIIFNYIAHGGKKISQPQNLPLWTSFLLGYLGENYHKNHHDDPSNPKFSKTTSLLNADIGYYIMKLLFRVKYK